MGKMTISGRVSLTFCTFISVDIKLEWSHGRQSIKEINYSLTEWESSQNVYVRYKSRRTDNRIIFQYVFVLMQSNCIQTFPCLGCM